MLECQPMHGRGAVGGVGSGRGGGGRMQHDRLSCVCSSQFKLSRDA